MEAAIRWSPRATPSDARFLIVDVDAHTIKLCEALGVRHGKVQWAEVSRNSKISPFHSFDWAAAHDIVAVGHFAGASVVGLYNGSPSLNLPLKLPRVCNAVAFNSDRLLASGVDKVRNDFCLNVYDVSHWPAAASSPTESRAVEPSHKLSMSEAITSIKFFPSSPQLLVAGVKGSCIRLYDLRENTGNPALQYHTSRVHNIAVDLSDDFYFASAGPATARDSTVQLWDRRSALRSRPNQPLDDKDRPLLELRDAVDSKAGQEPVSVWSLRFSPEKRGCLGMMGSNGVLKVYHLQKDYIQEDEHSETDSHDHDTYITPLSLQRTQRVSHPQQRRGEEGGESAAGNDRIVSFDFMNFHSSTGRYRAITLGLHQDAHVHEVYGTQPTLSVGHRNFIASSTWRNRADSIVNDEDMVAGGLRVRNAEQAINEILAKKRALVKGSLNYAKAAVRKESADIWRDWEDQIARPEIRPEAQTQQTVLQSASPKRVFQSEMKRRVQAGYLLHAGKNATIVSDDPALSLFWRWIQAAQENAEDDAMVGEGRDFSFLGVQNIINATLGAEAERRIRSEEKDVPYAMSWLAANLDLTGIEVKEGEYTARRRLALHAIGFRNDNLKQRVQQLAMAGQNAEAALRALILCDNSLVLGALTNGPRRKDMTFLFDDVHKWLTTDQEIDTERRKMISVYLNQEEDPFLHSIYHIMLSDGRQTLSQFDNAALPFYYRLGIALRYIEDDALKEYVDDETRAAIKSGALDKIMLTGLSEEGLKLIQSYLYSTNDVQTAALATVHVVPRYIRRNAEVERWREGYRSLLNSWHFYIQRCMFDMQVTGLAADARQGEVPEDANPPQVALCCNACDGPLMQDTESDNLAGRNDNALPAGAAGGTKVFGGGVLGGPTEVTQCPRCGARMPNCAVCDMPTGVLDPLSRGGTEKEKEDLENGSDPLDDLMETCMTCDHVTHHGCSEAWFRKHSICPAVGCECSCNELDDFSSEEERDYEMV